MDINKVILSGNVLGDSVVSTTSSGAPVCDFRLCVNNPKRNPTTGKWETNLVLVNCFVYGNAADVAGVSSWYRSDIAGEFAALLAEYTAGALGVRNRGAKYANYYVCRGEFCPCALLECGFMCSPGDFGRLTDDAAQATLARAVCDAVCEYFK